MVFNNKFSNAAVEDEDDNTPSTLIYPETQWGETIEKNQTQEADQHFPPHENRENIEGEHEFSLSDIIKQPTPLVKELLLFLNSSDETTQNQENDRSIDLYHLFTELATMKTELKYASRQMKTGLEEFKQVFSTLQQCNASLTAEIEQRTQREQRQIDAELMITLKPLLFHLIELHDSVERSLLSLTNYKPGIMSRIFGKRELGFLLSQQEGQRMLLSRIEQRLAEHRIKEIHAIKQPFDAKIMCVVGLKTDRHQPQGIVLEEVRKGYLWGEKLLRNSEVIVNKWDDQR